MSGCVHVTGVCVCIYVHTCYKIHIHQTLMVYFITYVYGCVVCVSMHILVGGTSMLCVVHHTHTRTYTHTICDAYPPKILFHICS